MNGLTTDNMVKYIPQDVTELMASLRDCGISAWLVGGCLRDILRGEMPADWDMAAAARPEELCRVLPKTVPTGLRFGTVTAFWGGISAEITCCRREAAYRDGRHPEKIVYTNSIWEDLGRRDFTIGAMAWNPWEGLIDPFGGQEDLRRGLLRCVGTAEDRLGEDGLRILRALRFASTLGFGIEAELGAALVKRREDLLRISGERIAEELRKLLMGREAEAVCRAYDEVLHVVLPGVRFAGVGGCGGDAAVRLAWVLCSVGGSAAAVIMERLRLSRELRRRVQGMLTYNSLYTDIPALLCNAGLCGARDVLDFWGMDGAELEALADGGYVWRLSQLAVKGGDALAAGVAPGDVGRALRRLREWVGDGVLVNDRDALRERLRSWARRD